MNKLFILTLTWNGKDKLEKLYKSLMPSIKNIDWIWGIKDNGSIDGTFDFIQRWELHPLTSSISTSMGDRIHCYSVNNNLQNYSQGNNWLFKELNPGNEDYILLLNNDIIFQDTTSIKKMIDILNNDQNVGVVGAKLNYEDRPNIIQHCGVLPHSSTGTPYHYRAGQKEEEKDCKNRLYPMVTGAVMMVRASLWKELGGLNESLRWSWDDSFFCMMTQEKGYKIVYCGETNILHSESATLKKNPQNKLFFQQNIRIFMDRWKNKMDKTLVEKYTKDPNYMLYYK